MKTVAIVPIKLYSSRFNGKNVKAFDNGKPLCWYIFDTLLKVKSIDEIYVYCSNPAIKDYIPEEIRFLKRSEHLDSDETKMNEILKAFSEDVPADLYVMTHATAPFISEHSIQKGINAVQNEGYDSAFAVKKSQEFFWYNNKPFNYDLNLIPRTQDLPEYFCETSGFYIYKQEIIRDMYRRIGEHPKLIEVTQYESIDIDEKSDFEMANALYNYYLKQE